MIAAATVGVGENLPWQPTIIVVCLAYLSVLVPFVPISSLIIIFVLAVF